MRYLRFWKRMRWMIWINCLYELEKAEARIEKAESGHGVAVERPIENAPPIEKQ